MKRCTYLSERIIPGQGLQGHVIKKPRKVKQTGNREHTHSGAVIMLLIWVFYNGFKLQNQGSEQTF